MADIQKLEQKMDEAIMAPYLIDRLEQLKNLRTEINAALDDYESGKREASGRSGITPFFSAFATVATAFIRIVGAILGMTGVATDTNRDLSTNKSDEIWALKNLADKVNQLESEEIRRFHKLSAEQRAGIVKLEEIAGNYPEIRKLLIQDFRQSVTPVPERRRIASWPLSSSVHKQNFEANDPEAGPV